MQAVLSILFDRNSTEFQQPARQQVARAIQRLGDGDSGIGSALNEFTSAVEGSRRTLNARDIGALAAEAVGEQDNEELRADARQVAMEAAGRLEHRRAAGRPREAFLWLFKRSPARAMNRAKTVSREAFDRAIAKADARAAMDGVRSALEGACGDPSPQNSVQIFEAASRAGLSYNEVLHMAQREVGSDSGLSNALLMVGNLYHLKDGKPTQWAPEEAAALGYRESGDQRLTLNIAGIPSDTIFRVKTDDGFLELQKQKKGRR